MRFVALSRAKSCGRTKLDVIAYSFVRVQIARTISWAREDHNGQRRGLVRGASVSLSQSQQAADVCQERVVVNQDAGKSACDGG